MSDSGWQASKKAGNEAFTAGKVAEAAEHYTNALKDDGVGAADRATILCNRAQCYLDLAKNEAAVEDCTACLTLSPGNVKALFRRAAAEEALGDHKAALADYKATLELNSTVAAAAQGLKRCQAALGITPAPSSSSAASSKSGGGGGALTEEDGRMIAEAKARVEEVAKRKAKAEMQQKTAALERKRCLLTLSQMEGVPEGRALFKGVGKTFVRTARPELVTMLEGDAAKAEQKLKVCSSTLEYLAGQEKEADAAFLELIGTMRKKMARSG